jgi:hypothetical protein
MTHTQLKIPYNKALQQCPGTHMPCVIGHYRQYQKVSAHSKLRRVEADRRDWAMQIRQLTLWDHDSFDRVKEIMLASSNFACTCQS